MKLSGAYTLTITGDTRALQRVSATTYKQIGYQMERLLTGQEAAVEHELAFFGISVDLDDGFVTVPRYPDSVQLEPTPEMIEAGWQVLDREGIEAPAVETMIALWAAMERAR